MSSSTMTEPANRIAKSIGGASKALDSVQQQHQFVYTPLTNPNNIRLIWLEPGHQDGPIVVSLFESLCKTQWNTGRTQNHPIIFANEAKDALGLLTNHLTPSRLFASSKRAVRNVHHGIKLVEYQTLSYVWGDATDIVPITVNGNQFKITRNLHHFLEQARTETGRQGPYWIDALSINQKDDIEKSAQVKMMGHIYSNSSLCIAWLGKEDTRTKIAFELLRAIETKTSHACKNLCKESLEGGDISTFDSCIERLHTSATSGRRSYAWRLYILPGHQKVLQDLDIWKFDAAPFSALGWEGVYEFLSRPWFTRMWILQEFVLPEKVEFVCGSQKLGDLAVLVFVRLAGLYGGEISERVAADFDFGLKIKELPLYGPCLNRVSRNDIFVTSLASSVSLTGRDRRSTDPRDKIYALMSMSSQKKPFPVDYSQPVPDVYRSFAVHTLQTEALNTTIELFNAVGLQGSVSGLPSWVPDWTSTGRAPTAFTWYSTGGHFGELFGRPNDHLYEGAGGHSPAFRFSADLTVLKGHGIEFDTIRAVHLTPFVHLHYKQIKEYIAEEGLQSGGYKPSNESLEEIILRAASCDIVEHGTVRPQVRQSKAGIGLESNLDGGYFAIDFSGHRPLVSTQTGYMGIAPEKSEVGDIVAVLVGQPFPFILRKRDDHYTMVGLCFVHGIMDGEVMNEAKAGKRIIKEFQIC